MNIPKIVISPAEWAIVSDILQRHVPGREVWAFGSRAKWTSKEFSDLDLAIIGDEPLSITTLASLSEDFSESELPYKVDIVDWATTSASFRKVIERDKTVVQQRGEGIPPGWSVTNLGSITKWLSGGTPRKDVLEYWGGDIPWISANSMHSTRLADSELKITHLGLAAGSRIAPKDSILLLVRGGALHNRLPIGIATHDVAFNQDVKALAADKGKINPWYLLYWLMSQERFLLGSVVEFTGIGAGKLDTARMQALEVILPPLSEQENILEIIKAVDDKIVLLRETNTTLEAIAQALFKSWFVNFDPVRAKVEGREPEGIPPEVADLFPSEFEDSGLGKIPKGWRVGKLGEISRNLRFGAKPDELTDDTAYIGLEHMPRQSIALDEWESASKVESGKSRFRKGQILFGKLRPYFHKVGIAPLDGVCSTDILVIEPSSPAWDAVCVCLFSSKALVEHATQLSNGAKMPRTNWADLANYPIVVPPDEIAQAFESVVSPLLGRIPENVHQAKALAETRDTLLPRLMSGTLHISQTGAPQ